MADGAGNDTKEHSRRVGRARRKVKVEVLCFLKEGARNSAIVMKGEGDIKEVNSQRFSETTHWRPCQLLTQAQN